VCGTNVASAISRSYEIVVARTIVRGKRDAPRELRHELRPLSIWQCLESLEQANPQNAEAPVELSVNVASDVEERREGHNSGPGASRRATRRVALLSRSSSDQHAARRFQDIQARIWTRGREAASCRMSALPCSNSKRGGLQGRPSVAL